MQFYDEIQSLEQSIFAMLKTIHGQGQTLTESKQEISQESNRIRAIVSALGEGVLVVDQDLMVTLANPIAIKLLNLPVEQIVGKKFNEFAEILQGDDVLPFDQWPVRQSLLTRKTIITDLEDNFYVRTKGYTFPVIMSSSFLAHTDKTIEGVLVLRDVSDDKQLDDSKSSFISTASHQLRTPLTAMRWFGEMLIGGDAGQLTEQQQHLAQQMYAGTNRLIDLVNLLLQIARVEARRVMVQPVMIETAKLVQEAIEFQRLNFDAKKQVVRLVTQPKIPQLAVDREMILNVLQNLLSNANRYSPEGGTITVNIRLTGQEVEFSVADNGIGIPVTEQDKIFRKFYRAPNALAQVPEGSGLGLSLVKSLVESWKGRIWFESTEGHGTTFYFTIPLKGMEAKAGPVSLAV